MPFDYRYVLALIAAAAVAAVLITGYYPQSGTTDPSPETKSFAGTWVLKARVEKGKEEPAATRQMVLDLSRDGTFEARYRGNPDQEWIKAGSGAYTYLDRMLTFYWDSGGQMTMMVVQRDNGRMVLHQGRSLVPLRDQEPQEIYVKEKPESAGKSSSRRLGVCC